jgi:hypothetical protein
MTRSLHEGLGGLHEKEKVSWKTLHEGEKPHIRVWEPPQRGVAFIQRLLGFLKKTRLHRSVWSLPEKRIFDRGLQKALGKRRNLHESNRKPS